MESWLDIRPDSDFSLANLPFGIISTADDPRPRPAVAVGDSVLDLQALSAQARFYEVFSFLDSDSGRAVFVQPTLNAFAALGRAVHRATRAALQGLLRAAPATEHAWFLRDDTERRRVAIRRQADVQMHLPMAVGDYTDFYAGVHHARAAGTLLRGAARALQPNYGWLPVAYHGRASSVVVSGTGVRRPWGQVAVAAPPSGSGSGTGPVAVAAPGVEPTRKLDFELELGCFVATGTFLGTAVATAAAEDHIFGYVLLNDWSARDIQSWEYVPLGPFNGKNFQTSISPWVVLADALRPLRTPALRPDQPLLAYLDGGDNDDARYAFNMEATVDLTTPHGTTTIARVNTKNLQWSFPQMIAHHTLGGCPLRTGDLLGSGTISGTAAGESGCLLEMTRAGTEPVPLTGGGADNTRVYLEDGDIITLRASASAGPEGGRIGFGECSGRVQPAEKRTFSP